MDALLLTRASHCRAVMINSIAAALMILISAMSAGIIAVQARPLGEDEIEAHLNRLNKPAVRSITLEEGETIDCVDIYKQPAFDHPLLKDHKIVMSPSFVFNTSGEHHIIQPQWHETEGCPDGTIPIRRVQKSDLIRATSLEGFGRRDGDVDLIERAGVFADSGEYNGIRADVQVWDVSVQNDEWSHASVQLTDVNENIEVEAGWMVNPSLYGDARPRIFSYWTVDGQRDSGCFNLLCSGFIQVGSQYVLGNPIAPLSTYGGVMYKITTTINKDDVNQIWWLTIQGQPVGYWPMSIFVQFGDFFHAVKMMAGGAVLNKGKQTGTHTTTQMGNGHFAEEGWGKAAAIGNLQLFGTDNKLIENVYTMASILDCKGCYNVQFDSPKIIYYGGPGGQQC